MNKKIFLTSILAIGFAMPAMADNITNASQCTTGVLGQSDNNSTANVEAEWTPIQYSEPAGQYLLFENNTITQHVTCPAGYYCEGFTDEEFADASIGIYSCAENDESFPYSAAGTKISDMCYNTGTVACATLNPYTGGNGTANYANSTNGNASYKEYSTWGTMDEETGDGAYLDNINACKITSLTCNTGYRQVDGGPLSEYVHQNTLWEPEYVRWKPLNGDSGYKMSDDFGVDNSTGLSNGAWEVTWLDGTKVAGTAMCSSTSGNWAETGTPDSTAGDGTRYCWCKMGSYTLNGAQSAVNVGASSSWVFSTGCGSASDCANDCADRCANVVQYNRGFRGALFGSLGANPVCTANTINIQWYNQNTVHESNSCTYGDTITLPSTNPTRTGYTFGGWQLRTTNN